MLSRRCALPQARFSGSVRAVGRFTIAASDPCVDGHFPGHPVVPGVVLLEQALALAAPNEVAEAIEVTKFLSPVLPGQVVEVACEMQERRVMLTCRVGGGIVMTATARLAGTSSWP
jgi:3-hydroxyacyl-[acyl-carrier-protein] dehydratase